MNYLAIAHCKGLTPSHDLWITQEEISFEYFPPAPEPAPLDTEITMKARVKNEGNVIADPVTVEYWKGRPGDEWKSTDTLRRIESKKSQGSQIPLMTESIAGSYLYSVSVSCPGETRVDNNAASQILQVGHLPGSDAWIFLDPFHYRQMISPGSLNKLSGRAWYGIKQYGGEPDKEFPLQGGKVTTDLWRQNGDRVFSLETYTVITGHFYQLFMAPSVSGSYELRMEVTDGSLTSNWSYPVEVFTTPTPVETITPTLPSRPPTPPPIGSPAPTPGPEGDIWIHSEDIDFTSDPINPPYYQLGETVNMRSVFHYRSNKQYSANGVQVYAKAYLADVGYIDVHKLGEDLSVSFSPGRVGTGYQSDDVVRLPWTNWASGVYVLEFGLKDEESGKWYNRYSHNDIASRTVFVGQTLDLTALITLPMDNAVLHGSYDIIGVAGGSGFRQYSLQYCLGQVDWRDNNQNWQEIAASTEEVIGGVLAEWETGLLADETYTLRLVVTGEEGEITGDGVVVGVRNNLEIPNVIVRPPVFNPFFKENGEVQERTQIVYELAYPAVPTIRVLDGAGNVLKEWVKPAPEFGVNSVWWNGRDENNAAYPPGTYRIEVEASAGTPVIQTGFVDISDVNKPVIADAIKDYPDPIEYGSGRPTFECTLFSSDTPGLDRLKLALSIERSSAGYKFTEKYSNLEAGSQGTTYIESPWNPPGPGIYQYTLQSTAARRLSANSKKGTISVKPPSYITFQSPDERVTVYGFQGDSLTITEMPQIPSDATLALASMNRWADPNRNYLELPVYDISGEATFPLGVEIDYDPSLYGEVLKLIYFDETDKEWKPVEYQYVDFERHKIIAELWHLSLYTLLALGDNAPPEIAGLSVSPTIFSPDGDEFQDTVEIAYALSDDLSSHLWVTAEIYDENGNPVVTLLSSAKQDLGENFITWDGTVDEEGNLAPGDVYGIVLEAEDTYGNRAKAEINVSLDNSPPEITVVSAPSSWINTDGVVEFKVEDTDPDLQVSVAPPPASLSGPDSSGIYTAVYTEEMGITQITIIAVDSNQNTAQDTSVSFGIDRTPPQVSVSAAPSELWPPNHKPVDVAINGSSSDALSGIESVTFQVIDEYGECEPIVSNFGDVIKLIAWRNGSDKDGRVYTVSVEATDKAGNSSSAQTTVLVPHDQGEKNK